MKKSIVKIATVVWAIGLVLTAMMLSIPPANVPLYIGLACIAIIPLILGSRAYRVFGAVALVISMLLAIGEHSAGIVHKEKMEHIRQLIEQRQETNTPPLNP